MFDELPLALISIGEKGPSRHSTVPLFLKGFPHITSFVSVSQVWFHASLLVLRTSFSEEKL